MSLISTNNYSFSELLLQKIKTFLLLAVFAVSSFNVFAQGVTMDSCDDFVTGPNATWTHVLVATTVADGAVSQGAQTFSMNVTSLPAGGANVRVYKTTANGSDFFATPVALTLGTNSITVAAVSFDRAVKFQFSSGAIEFDALSLNGVDTECIAPTPPPPTSLISDCGDFVSGPSAWPYVLIATTVADGSASQGSQTFTMNVTSLPAGGANVRVYKTTANGSDFFATPVALTLGSNSITVTAVSFDRAVKFQFSSGDVEFDALSLNGVDSDCALAVPPPTSLISDCGDFVSGPSAWPYVLVATTVADGLASQGAQTFTMNVTSLPVGGANVRVYKTTANGSDFFGNTVALTLGANSITVSAVTFDRAVKFQFSSGDVEFDALSLNGVVSDCALAVASIPGCTDPTAFNYNASANTDDGSCIAVVNGCTDDTAFNYDASANTDDGSCIAVVNGCTDDTAFNYDVSANTDDGSCIAVVNGCTDDTASNYDASANTDDSSCVFCSDNFVAWSVGGGSYDSEISWSILDASGTMIASGFAPESGDICLADGCYTLDMVDSWGDGWNGASFTIDGQSFGLTSGANATETFCLGVVAGCTDPAADNYNASATTDDGSCTYPCLDNEVAFDMIDSWGDGWNGGTYTITDGTNTATGGLTSGAAATDTLCLPTGCYTVTVGGGSYDSEISFDFGSLVGAAAGTYTDISVGGAVCGVSGCTDPAAANYDAAATVDDGSCVYCTDNYVAWSAGGGSFTSEVGWSIVDGSGAVMATGGAPASGDICLPDGCYSLDMTDSWGDGWNGNTFTIDGQVLGTGFTGGAALSETFCLGVVAGCTDPAASNYDASATTDDGSCTYPCLDNTIDMVMFDSWGDGWNGGTYTITDGTNTATGGLTGGSTGTDGLCLPDGCYDVSVGGGTFDSEITFDFGSLVGAAAGTYQVEVGAGVCTVLGCTDASASNYDAAANTDDGNCLYPFTFVVDMNCAILGGLSFTTVYASGPFNGWSADANPLSDADGDGIWEGTYDLLANDIEYKYQVDMWADQEDLIDDMVNGGTCAPVTDYFSFANRLATNTTSGFVTDDNYGSCDDCDPTALAGCTDATADNYDAAAISDNGSCLYTMTFEVDMNCADFTPGVMFLTGPADGWSGSSYAMDDADGDGVWSGTFQIAAPFEYIYTADYWAQSETAGLIDAMVNGGTCAPNTDYFSYANRMVTSPVGGSTVSEVWGSCDACVPVLGCTDPTADNYDATATSDDGSCTYVGVLGCTDATASNYNDLATTDDGSCLYPITFTVDMNCYADAFTTVYVTGPFAGWCGDCFPLSDADGDGVWEGTYDFAAGDVEYKYALDNFAHQEDLIDDMVNGGSCAPITDYWSFANRSVTVSGATVTDDNYGSCDDCVPAVLGCTDANADNYDASATTDDGSCTYPCLDNEVAFDMIDSWGDGWNGGTYTITDGTNTATGGLTSGAAATDTLCLPTGCYTVTVGGGSYDSEISFDFGSLVGAAAGTYTDISVGGAVCGVSGCTDPAAANYDAAATVDDGSCVYCTDNYVAWSAGGGSFTSEVGWSIVDGSGAVMATGGAPASGDICLPDGCYSLDMTDSWGDGWNGNTFTIDGQVLGTGFTGGAALSETFCLGVVAGCTDPAASNYDASATTDDGSCTYPCLDNTIDMVMFDSWGDGWNGGTYTITDGTNTATGGLTGGSTGTDGLCLPDGCYDVSVGGGTFDSEITFDFGSLVGAAAGTYQVEVGAGVCTVLGCTDASASNYDAAANTDDGNCLYPFTFVVDMNCAILGGLSFTTVYASGPFNGWSADANPLSDADGDGIWEGTYDLLANDIEYKYQVDMWADQEDLIDDMVNGGTCAPVTDYFSFANRLATNTTSGFVTDDNYGSCDDCDPTALAGCTDATADNYDAAAISDNGSCLYTMTFEVDMNCADFTPGVMFLTGPADGWSGSSYAMDDADGDGVWSGTFQIAAPFEYIYTADYWAQSETAGLIDAMVNGGTCAPNTDYFSYANRMVTSPVGGSTVSEVWGSCDACVPAVLGCTDANADNYDASATTDDGSCTYCSTFALSIDSQSDVSAAGATDGTAIVSGSGGTSPYSISWPANPNALAAGTYTVTATDAAGCTTSIDVTIDEPSVAVCSAPTGLNTYDVVHTRATFNFTSTGADYYKIRVKENGGAWQVITQLGTATGTPGGNTKTKYFLTADVSYEWQVRAWCIDGQVSGWSTSAFFNTLPECPNATNQYASDIEAEWAVLNWDAPTNTVAGVNYYLARIQEDGASAWNIVTPANGGTDNFKLKGQLIPGATYNFETRTWCNTGDANNPTDPYYKSDWGGSASFTTIPCPVQTSNLYTTSVNATTQFFGADFIADANVPYDHFTLRYREVGATAWELRSITAAHIAAGGRNVGALTTGAEYEWGIRTFCGTGSTWKSPWESGPNFVVGGSSARLVAPVTALEVYPNPSRDIFNLSFTSEEAQTINVKVVNLIGEVVYTENLEEFTGQYTNIVDMNTQPKGVYFLEITTNTGGINKKIVLQ